MLSDWLLDNWTVGELERQLTHKEHKQKRVWEARGAGSACERDLKRQVSALKVCDCLGDALKISDTPVGQIRSASLAAQVKRRRDAFIQLQSEEEDAGTKEHKKEMKDQLQTCSKL